MKTKQISVFLKNRPGWLVKVTCLLGANGINIRAFTIADTSDFGILRLIVDRPEKAVNLLQEAGFPVCVTDVLVIEIPDVPGGLTLPLEHLKEVEINVEYAYAFLTRISELAFVVLNVDRIDEAVRILREKNVNLIDSSKI